jgi:hypothetical protein
MLLPPTRFVFRSRWWALAWAAGICWMAYDFAGGDQSDTQNAAVADNADDPIGNALSAQ